MSPVIASRKPPPRDPPPLRLRLRVVFARFVVVFFFARFVVVFFFARFVVVFFFARFVVVFFFARFVVVFFFARAAFARAFAARANFARAAFCLADGGFFAPVFFVFFVVTRSAPFSSVRAQRATRRDRDRAMRERRDRSTSLPRRPGLSSIRRTAACHRLEVGSAMTT